MKNILYIFLIPCFSFTIISCAKKSGGSSGSSSSCNNSKASIVGNAVTEKCSRTDCPVSKIVIWDLDGCMMVVGDSVMGAVDAALIIIQSTLQMMEVFTGLLEQIIKLKNIN